MVQIINRMKRIAQFRHQLVSNFQGKSALTLGTAHNPLTLFLSLSFFWIISSLPASAHHALGNNTPQNFFEGFLSGVAHPIIGLDHFAFVVAIGLIAAGTPQKILIPLGFVVAALAGTGIHLMSIDLPFTEITIALSVVAFGVMLAIKNRINPIVIAALAPLAGLFHGYAYGESIIGAKMTPLVAYLAGFTIIQFAIALAAMTLFTRFYSTVENRQSSILKFAGFSILAVGMVYFANALMS